MKRILGPQRPAAELSLATERSLCHYVLAARAAGVGFLALAVPIEAKIVYTPAHHVVTHGGSYKLDLNHDGVTDFTLKVRFSTSCSGFISSLSVKPAAGNGAQGWTGLQPYAFALKGGARIGPADYFPGREMASVHYRGSWVNVRNRYLGLRFKVKGQTHFGWARLSVQVQSQRVVGTLTGYAYETLPNKAIVAGRTKRPDVITLEPGSLGRLAQGWAGRFGK